MLDGDLLALRPGGAEEGGAGSAPPLGPAPAPMAPEPARRAWRVGAGLAVAAAVTVHALLLLGFPALWRSLVRDVGAPEPITVELVARVPEPPEAKPEPKPKPAPPPEAKEEQPPAPAPMPPPAQPDKLAEAMRSGLVEPPPEARPAAAQDRTNQPANATPAPEPGSATPPPAATTPPKPAEAAAPPPAAPAVLAAAEAESSVPAPAEALAETPAPPAPQAPALPSQPPSLAAALPMSGLPVPTTFRSALTAFGTAENATYRGSFFGALTRARQGVEAEARARHLRGQVVLAIVLTEAGAIASAAVVQSSGHPDADAFALAMIRRAAPFPPPPPGVSRTFTPAISFGES